MSEKQRVFYSASRLGFFSPSVHQDMPPDAVAISSKRHAALLAGQAEGYEIVPDERGQPQLRSLVEISIDAAKAAGFRAIKREAARRIEARMPVWRQLNALRDNSDPGFHAIDLIRQASNLIEEQLGELGSIKDIAAFPIADHPLWPQFDAPQAED